MIAVPSDDLLTAEQFVAGRHELPDGGRWTELRAGRPVLLSPPTVEHGNAVLNLGKALAEYSQRGQGGYACFELGLVVARDPDTVQLPAACFFRSSPLLTKSSAASNPSPPRDVNASSDVATSCAPSSLARAS